ncbi:MAG: hypothetical protein KAT86_04930 [Candidatus Latescibacteria bacterium]|nr:hypothetical protein [Candidatus Latescibacterota bacterium]
MKYSKSPIWRFFLMLTYLACSKRYEETRRQVRITTWDEPDNTVKEGPLCGGMRDH